MKFSITGPTILARTKRRKTPIPLKIIGSLRDGRKIAVNESKRAADASMAVFPGYLIYPGNRNLDKAAEIVVKFSPDYLEDKFLTLEKKILMKLYDLEGIPRVIEQGVAGVSYWGYDQNRLKCIERNAPFFVMSKIEGRNLNSLTLKMQEKVMPSRKEVAFLASKVFPLLAERLAGIHDKKVVHRDVKPQNVMIDRKEDSLTLIDFGRANWLNTSTPRSDFGTFGFLPPELILSKPKVEDVRVDVYALGVTCFKVLTGEKAILYSGMKNDWQNIWSSVQYFSNMSSMKNYYRMLCFFGRLSPEELIMLSNMPSDLKQTGLGKYLGRLFHPARIKRPYNMWKIAENLRKFGGELAELEIWS
ncbi:hypothetical protein AMJ44_02710 [candidate division WOR-1 bacterium DG_54_3]|uniref:Protein kinase domain-containing protein n=1 Tax=candidate division WOR-1 bacterium DG_54_3 TaxID=1703775 RepID=A0A0S7Y4R0_UNCSA|nr:MAG: hypothetical protein AMJ44_02710 [candidate division WOR-1 bacterium DG_54_3]